MEARSKKSWIQKNENPPMSGTFKIVVEMRRKPKACIASKKIAYEFLFARNARISFTKAEKLVALNYSALALLPGTIDEISLSYIASAKTAGMKYSPL